MKIHYTFIYTCTRKSNYRTIELIEKVTVLY